MKSLIYFLLPLASLASLSVAIAGAPSKGKSDMKKPWYTVQVDAGGSPYEVRINDCPVTFEPEGLPVKMSLPVNQFLVNGKNQLTVYLYDSGKETGDCRASLNVQEYAEGAPEPNQLVQVEAKLPPSNDPKRVQLAAADGDIFVEPIAVKTVEIDLKVPFPTYGYAQATPRKDLKTVQTELKEVVKDFWTLLSKRKIKEIETLMKPKLVETAAARYLTMDERVAEFRSNYKDFFDDLKLAELDLKDLEIVSYAGGRLFLVRDALTFKSPVYFVNKEKTLASYIDLYFARDSSGAWKVVR